MRKKAILFEGPLFPSYRYDDPRKISFNSGHVLIHLKICLTEISSSVMKSLGDLLKKAPSRKLQNKPDVMTKFCALRQ